MILSRRSLFTCILLGFAGCWVCIASSAELNTISQTTGSNLMRELFNQDVNAAPFSFMYGGQAFAGIREKWEYQRQTTALDDQRAQTTMTWKDPATGLLARCEAVEYYDFPVVEWTVYLKNEGQADTPLLENIQGMDINLDRGAAGEYILHHARGSYVGPTDYEPLTTPLAPNTVQRLAPEGGRGSNKVWPYFNIEWRGAGRIIAVGWPGQWAAEFTRDEGGGLRILAGQELTRLVLHPGEEIRTPLMAMLSYEGMDWLQAQNVWRRWMIAHSMPRPGGQPPKAMLLASSSRAYVEMTKADEASQIMFIDRFEEEGLKLDYWWMDAGWYPLWKDVWTDVGTWEVDATRFPNGLGPISDHAHAKGLKTLLWFEPERCEPGTWIAKTHPEWIMGKVRDRGGNLVDLTNPEVQAWLIERIDTLLKENRIDLYREDFNMDPLEFWRGNDAPDRQGMTESKYIVAHLAYWDELRRRHPDMLIDSCASGGRRNDLETMRRAVPLWRSDYPFEPASQQCMTYGLSLWLPYFGTGTVAQSAAAYYGGGVSPVEPYAFWSNAAPSLSCGFDMRVKELDYAMLRRLFDQFRLLSPNYYGDFHPLTSYTLDPTAWMAWQFDSPESGEGMVQAFRRDQSPIVTCNFALKGIQPDANYMVTNVDTGESNLMSSEDLARMGFTVTIDEKPGYRNYKYTLVR